jgi:hypothetical protein
MIESAFSTIIFRNSDKNFTKEIYLSLNLSGVMSVVKMPGRLIITIRDIMNITGMSYRTAQRMAREVRQAFNKNSYDYITIEEFCIVFKFNEERVREYMLF